MDVRDEIIDGHLVTADTKKLWSVEMDLAQKLLDVCKKHNLRIWAEAGTLLGAVRHKGFIPWDDDMDFSMMREDYEKLIEIGPKEFEYPYFFQSFYTDNFWGGMLKIRRSDTAMIEGDYMNHQDFNRGIFIDIFALDAVPKNQLFELKYNIIKFLRRIIKNYRKLNPKVVKGKAKLSHLLIGSFCRLFGVKNLEKGVGRLLSMNKIANNEEIGMIDFFALEQWNVSKIKRRPKKSYDDTIYLPFYDMQLPAPKGYHEVLTSWYGDYMTPVKGGALHDNIIVDCEKSYDEVINNLRLNQI